MNLCFLFEEKHVNHNIKSFNQMDNYDDKDKINKQLIKLRKYIDNNKEKINNIMKICNNIINTYEILYNIRKYIFDNINKKFRNIQKIKNQQFINNDIIYNIETIINTNNIDNQLSKIIIDIFNFSNSLKTQAKYQKLMKNLIIHINLKEIHN